METKAGDYDGLTQTAGKNVDLEVKGAESKPDPIAPIAPTPEAAQPTQPTEPTQPFPDPEEDDLDDLDGEENEKSKYHVLTLLQICLMSLSHQNQNQKPHPSLLGQADQMRLYP